MLSLWLAVPARIGQATMTMPAEQCVHVCVCVCVRVSKPLVLKTNLPAIPQRYFIRNCSNATNQSL